MATAISSCGAEFPVGGLDACAAVLRARRPNPYDVLLALRAPGFADLAWRKGRSAALRMERRAALALRACALQTLRKGDAIAHDPGSDMFLVALLAAPRTGAARLGTFRPVLARLAERLARAVQMELECGWQPLEAVRDAGDLLRLAAAALERGERERDRYEFFAAVGHELRTPLTSIRGYIETVLEMPASDATSRHFLKTAHGEALRMGRMLEGMFQFSLLEISGATAEADVRDCIRRACEIVRPCAAARGIPIECAGERIIAAIDADLLLQALVNVLDNAVKYGKDGGRIWVSAAAADGAVRICVDDDGPGVDPSQRERIFAYRSRGRSAAPIAGTGIGLSIVKTIVERAGGSIDCGRSEAGGARFTISLPAGADFRATAS